MQVLTSTIPNNAPLSSLAIPILQRQNAEIKDNKPAIQHVVLKSSVFTEDDIKVYAQHGKVLNFQKIHIPYTFSDYSEYDYILIDISKSKNLKWFEAYYKKIPDTCEVSGIPHLVERLGWDGKEADPNNWLSFCDNLLDSIPDAQVFKDELDNEHTKACINRSNLLITGGKLLCGCLGLKK